MYHRTAAPLLILRIVLGLVVGAYSIPLLLSQLNGPTHHPLLLLAVAELIAEILFLIPGTVWLGGIALICVFALAAGFHALHHEYNMAHLAVYGAAAWAVISGERGTRNPSASRSL